MRINEIAQLALDDFSEVDGIPVIMVRDDDDGKRIKTSAGRRTIPVHPELIEAGLLDYVAQLRAKRVQRLFPELSRQRDGCLVQRRLRIYDVSNSRLLREVATAAFYGTAPLTAHAAAG